MTNGIKLDKDSFSGMDVSAQNTVLFENTEEILEALKEKDFSCKKQVASCNTRINKLEKRKVFDKSLAGVTGAIAGFFSQFIPK